MPRIYCQARKEKLISVIGDGLNVKMCKEFIAKQAIDWINTKKGRFAKPLGNDEMAFYYSDGKLAATVWIDCVPAPESEPKFAPAVGEIPGLR